MAELPVLTARHMPPSAGSSESFESGVERICGHVCAELRADARSAMLRRDFLPSGRTWASASGVAGADSLVPNCCVLDAVYDVPLIQRMLDQTTGVGVSLGPHAGLDPLHYIGGNLCRRPPVDETGRRPGLMVTLPFDDPRLPEFIALKQRPLQDPALANCNISVVFPATNTDTGIKRSQADADADTVLCETARMAARCGDPGVVWAADRNQATAPCGELLLDRGEACTLGALNLTHFVDWATGDILEPELRASTQLAIRTLQGFIPQLRLPREMLEVCLRNRRVGLGVAGWADVLSRLGLPYGGPEACDLALRMGACIADAAREAAVDSGGVMPVGLLAVPPTGGIARLLGVSWSIEPHFAEATKLPPAAHLNMVAAWQAHVDGAVSKTVNLARGSSAADVLDVYRGAARRHLRGITVFVDGCFADASNFTLPVTALIEAERAESTYRATSCALGGNRAMC